MKLREALDLRSIIEQASQSLSDDVALSAVSLHPKWTAGNTYAAGQRVSWQGLLYRCLVSHTAQEAWTPDTAHSLWTRVLTSEEGEILQWVQPESTNGYSKGDRVRHRGRIWISELDQNVWEPGVYGWSEI